MDAQPHLLVVDDDRDIRTLVRDYLNQNGYRVSLAVDGRQMHTVLEQSRIDLVILDLMLPGEDGLSLCRKLRAQASLPVLMLTAKSEPIDRILGLELGADDYLTKPFEPRELLARIRNILRRAQSLPPNLVPERECRYRFAGWLLDTRTHQLTSPRAVTVILSMSEFRLLKVFLAHPNRVLSRDQLMDLVKGREQDAFDRSIDLRVSRLRHKLQDDAKAPRLIKTLRNEGYVLAAAVEAEYD
ncbi:response regulator [Methyloparacoccus murrellii]|jgi:two-component system OmpR family response regulator